MWEITAPGIWEQKTWTAFKRFDVNVFLFVCRGGFGLWLDADLYHGSSFSCPTFHNASLSTHEDFIVQDLEVWTVRNWRDNVWKDELKTKYRTHCAVWSYTTSSVVLATTVQNLMEQLLLSVHRAQISPHAEAQVCSIAVLRLDFLFTLVLSKCPDEILRFRVPAALNYRLFISSRELSPVSNWHLTL